MELPGTTNLLAFHAVKQEGESPSLDPALNFEDISELLKPPSRARTYFRMNSLAERTYPRLMYALSVGQLAVARRFRVATLTRCICTAMTSAPYTLSQLVPDDAAYATRQSGMVERGQKPAHEICAEVASGFNSLADERSRPPHSRRLPASHPEQPRNTANPGPAMGSSRNRRCDSSSSDDVWQFGNRSRQRLQYFLQRRTSLCIAGAMASLDIAVATDRRS